MAELGAGGGSGYPAAIDTDVTKEIDLVHDARADVPNDLADAIIKVQTELGVDPAGAHANVVIRLNNLDHYVDRGDPAVADFVTATFTTDGTWRVLDLSGIVPAGATTVHLTVRLSDDTPNNVFKLRKNGIANSINVFSSYIQVAATWNESEALVSLDAGRIIEYFATNQVWDNIFITIRGWWIP